MEYPTYSIRPVSYREPLSRLPESLSGHAVDAANVPSVSEGAPFNRWVRSYSKGSMCQILGRLAEGTLHPETGRMGALHRCRLTASDGNDTDALFHSGW